MILKLSSFLNMSQGTANPKQNLQNELYVLGKLRSDYAVRVVRSASSLKKPEVQADLSICWASIFLFVLASSLHPADRARSPQAHTLVTFLGF